MVPFIKAQGCLVGIASFGEADEESILSGIPLIRKYLNIAFGSEEKSVDMIPDDLIALWHPESKKEDPKKVGKQQHLAYLLNAKQCKDKGVKLSQCVLFDDDEHNIKIAKSKGLRNWYCEAVASSDTTSQTGFHRGIWADFVSKKGKGGGSCLIM